MPQFTTNLVVELKSRVGDIPEKPSETKGSNKGGLFLFGVMYPFQINELPGQGL